MHFLAVLLAGLAAHRVVLLVQATYNLQVLLEGYQNPGKNQSDGSCCDPPGCSDCENAFIVCIRLTMGQSMCDSELRTGQISGSGDLDFNEGDSIGRLRNPLVISALQFPERLEILLTVYDLDLSFDVTTSSDHLDDITIHPNITQASDTFTDIMSFTGFYSVSHVQLAFRLQCSPHYYGEDCSRYCIDTNDDTGHYSCGEAGDKVCLDGYQNPVTNCTECTQPAPNCSVVGGYCREPGECLCREGFSGDNCSVREITTPSLESLSTSLTPALSASLTTSSLTQTLLPSTSHTTKLSTISQQLHASSSMTSQPHTHSTYTTGTSSVRPAQPTAVPAPGSESKGGVALPLVISIAVNIVVILVAIAVITVTISLVCLRRRIKRRKSAMRSMDDVVYKTTTDEVKIKAVTTNDEDTNHIYETIPTPNAVRSSKTPYAAVNAMYDVVYDEAMELESNVAYGVSTHHPVNRQTLPLPSPP